MPRFELRESSRQLTSYAGLSLVGQCFEVAKLAPWLDGRLPVSGGMKTSDIVKSMAGLLCLGKNDFEAIEPFRGDRFFREALTITQVPSAEWLRQRLDALAGELREHTDELSVRLLERAEAPISAHDGFVRLDFDTFTLDNSGTKKEWVGRTDQGFDGYTPIAAYLGNEGWGVGLELRPGTQHSSLEADYFLERVFPRVRRLVPASEAVLGVADSGFDAAHLLFVHEAERERSAALERRFEWIVKWNPRKRKQEVSAADVN